jgi:hypothetical protein
MTIMERTLMPIITHIITFIGSLLILNDVNNNDISIHNMDIDEYNFPTTCVFICPQGFREVSGFIVIPDE